jgi:hypothetical protein
VYNDTEIHTNINLSFGLGTGPKISRVQAQFILLIRDMRVELEIVCITAKPYILKKISCQ